MVKSSALCPKLLVGVAGSIQSIYINQYLLTFRQKFVSEIKVIMTRSAARMINPKAVELLSDDRIYMSLWDRSESIKAPHIQLTRWADLFIVLPSTANLLGKAANGIADDLLTTSIVSYLKPIVFLPAMNPSMWQNPAVQRNIMRLKEDGHYIVPPVKGISITAGDWSEAMTAPPPDEVLPHLQHVRMKSLKEEYWDEATREAPLTPAEKKLRDIWKAKNGSDQPEIQVDS
jgi:phosphopantothenoylcysteine decarboxylase/phosphopantothenate--cysteine ligase